MKKFQLKRDKYRQSRGGYTRLLNISCSNCGESIILYQKDGPGILKRLYLDRIMSPELFIKYLSMDIKDIPSLSCSKCKSTLGSPYIYEKEKRKAILLNQGAFSKKIVKTS